MRFAHALSALALVVVLAPHAGADDGKGKKKGHAVHGIVIAVEKDKDKDSGTITVKVHHKKNKGATGAAPEEEKKFKVHAATKFEFVTGKKGDMDRKPAKFADVKKGERVVIVHKDDVALDVLIHHKDKDK